MPGHVLPAAPPPSPRDEELRLLQGKFQRTELMLAEGSVRTYAALEEATKKDVLLIASGHFPFPGLGQAQEVVDASTGHSSGDRRDSP